MSFTRRLGVSAFVAAALLTWLPSPPSTAATPSSARKISAAASIKAPKHRTPHVAPTAQQDIEQALRLQNAGFESESRELVKEVVKSSPKTRIPAELRSVNQRIGWWREFLGIAGPVLRVALEILAVGGGALVILLLVIAGVRTLVARFKPAAQLAGFEGSKEETLAAILSAALSAMLARMSDETAGRRVDWQGGTEPKFELPKAVTEAVPQAGLLAGIAQMLDGLLYRSMSVVSGTVHPVHEHRGAGLTLAVAKRNGCTVAQETFWESDFLLKEAGEDTTEPVRYERLIVPAAVWLAYRRQLGYKSKRPPLGARDWRSYALFALGELVPDAAKERLLYEKALDRDDGNLGARLNLASLLLQRPSYEVPPANPDPPVADGSRESWAECREAAHMHLGVVATRADRRQEAIWYRASYMQAVAYIYDGNGACAAAILSCLCKAMSINCETHALHDLIAELDEPVAILEQTAALIQSNPVTVPAKPDGGWRSATAEYNLACFWSRRVGATESTTEKSEWTVEAVGLLRRAVARRDVAAAEALVDPAFDNIRESPGFESVVQATTPRTKPTQSTRYEITLDPGPELVALVQGSGAY